MLSAKIKVLIVLVIGAETGIVQGAIALGSRALKMSAKKEMILETLRAAYQIGVNKALFASVQILQTLFK